MAKLKKTIRKSLFVMNKLEHAIYKFGVKIF